MTTVRHTCAVLLIGACSSALNEPSPVARYAPEPPTQKLPDNTVSPVRLVEVVSMARSRAPSAMAKVQPLAPVLLTSPEPASNAFPDSSGQVRSVAPSVRPSAV